MKLAPEKCLFLQRSVRFLGHVIDESGVSTDPEKVQAISAMTGQALMENDGVTPSQKKIKSVLGMVMYYQHFIQNCAGIAKPLFALIAASKRSKGQVKGDSDSDEVAARLDGHAEWEIGSITRATSWLAHDIQQLGHIGQSTLPVFSIDELRDKQQQDSILCRVLFYVVHGGRLTRRERANEMIRVLKMLKQWDKLKMLDGLLYSVSTSIPVCYCSFTS